MSKNYEKQRRWRERNPWYKHYHNARRRCLNSRHAKYKFYGGAGVEFRVKVSDVKVAWLRDVPPLNGQTLPRVLVPSLDRIGPSKHYEPGNIRFIELSENTSRPFKKRYPR